MTEFEATLVSFLGYVWVVSGIAYFALAFAGMPYVQYLAVREYGHPWIWQSEWRALARKYPRYGILRAVTGAALTMFLLSGCSVIGIAFSHVKGS